MTVKTPDSQPKPAHLSARKKGRIAAVLGLCLTVLPFTGFWSAANDPARGVTAVRIRLSQEDALTVPALLNRMDTPGSQAEVAPHDPSRYAARLSQVEREEFSSSSGIVESVLPKISSLRTSPFKPSQRYYLWLTGGTGSLGGNENFISLDDLAWLSESQRKIWPECPSNAWDSISQEMRSLLGALQHPLSFQPHPKAEVYKELIAHYSVRFGLSPNLVYAIMRTESAFNPLAVSDAGALGLMQVVPETAGNEVRAFLTGEKTKPSSSLLFDPKHNVEYGCAYLHLLKTRYFPGVSNSTVQELCMIAAYNAGPGAVLRLFHPRPEEAIKMINSLSSEEVYNKLSNDMPAKETRQYVGKVLASMSSYPG